MGPKLILGNPMNDRGGIHDHGIVHIPSDKGLGFLAHKNRNVKPLTYGVDELWQRCAVALDSAMAPHSL